jgi:hypothetical protein
VWYQKSKDNKKKKVKVQEILNMKNCKFNMNSDNNFLPYRNDLEKDISAF